MQRLGVKDDQFAVQTLRDAYEDLRQSKDPAVQYYIRPLTYLPEGSQRLNPDAVPEIEWRNHDQTRGRVLTPTTAPPTRRFVLQYRLAHQNLDWIAYPWVPSLVDYHFRFS